MDISDRKILNQEYFAHAHALKEKVEFNRKHDEERARVMHDKDRTMETRKITMKGHDEIKRQNLIAMDKMVDQRMAFIKSIRLNII